MKRRLFSFFLATLAVGLVGSCAKIDEQIADLDKRVEAIETQNLVSINTQIEAINSSIADLGQIRKDIQDLIAANGSQDNKIKALETADENIGKRIDELKAYVGDLSRYAEENWVKNTFATIDQLNKTAKDLEDLGGVVDGIAGELEGLGQTVEGLGQTVEGLGEKLAKDIKDASDKLAAQIKSLEDRVSALEKMIQTVSIVPAYTDGSVEALDDIMTIDCIVEPAEAVETLTEKNVFILSNVAKTKAATIDTIKVTKFGKDVEKGIITLKADITALELAQGEGLVIAVKVANGISQYTTEFAPVTIASSGLPKGSLYGEFSVSSTKKVHFSKSNVYYDGKAFQFEANQFDYAKAWDASHIGLFYWSKDAKVASDTKYADAQVSAEDVLFTNAPDFAINSTVTGFRTLSQEEWTYLLETRNNASTLYKAGVTVCGNKNCMVIAPDNFEGTIAASYNSDEWFHAEEAGLVCLPSTGIRSGSTLAGAEQINTYWTSTPSGGCAAYNVIFEPESEPEPETKALASTNGGSGSSGSGIDNSRKDVRFANIKNVTPSSDPRFDNRNSRESNVSTNGKQQSEQKEVDIKVLSENNFRKDKNANVKRSGANIHNSRPSTKFTSSSSTDGSTKITIGTFSPATYEGEYYVTLTDANSTTQFFYDFDTSVNPFELGKTYTLDDMIADYVAVGDKDDWYAWDPATAAAYTQTKDEKGLTHIVASMTTESGVTYDITYDQLPPQEVNVTAVEWAYDEEYYDVYVYSETTTYLFELKEDLVYGKAYTYADMVPSWTCTLVAGYPYITATDASLKVTKDEAGLVHIAATMTLSGDTHKIAYDEKPFAPSGNKIDVNGTDLNGRYMSAYGFYLYTAAWGDYTVQLAFDAKEEKAKYTNDDFVDKYCMIYSDDETIQFIKLASDITITETETAKTLAGSFYAKNGDEYVLNLVYEKPDAKEINITVDNATLTNKIAAGFWKIDGQTADKNNSFSIYFISKALQGTFTDVNQFDSYSTWVSDKSSGSNVYYENVSAVNITSVIDDDKLKITGTLNLADGKGNPAIVTLNVTTPFTQTWGEWADFAPFGLNTGKYNFATLGNWTQTKVQVQMRKDNTGLKQYNLKNWGKGYFDGVGHDLIFNMKPDNTFSFVSDVIDAGAEVIFADVATVYGNPAYASLNSYDPETGTFDFYTAIVIASTGQIYKVAEESFVMDQPITQRDTVKVNSSMTIVPEVENGIIKVSAEDANNTYILEVVGSEIVGKFSLKDGTLSQKYYYGIVSKDGTSRSDFAEGEVVISKNGKRYNLTGLMIGDDEKAYVLDWQGLEGVLEYDTDAPFDAEFPIADASVTFKNGVVKISATNAENKVVSLELYIDPAATEIPAGVYVISDTQEVATALKSKGVIGGYLTSCYAGTLAVSGGVDGCWFMQEGSITISYDEHGQISIVVDAKNSWEQNVTARFVPGLNRKYGLPIRLVTEVEK